MEDWKIGMMEDWAYLAYAPVGRGSGSILKERAPVYGTCEAGSNEPGCVSSPDLSNGCPRYPPDR